MTWSAGITAIVASGSLRLTNSAARPMQGAVSRLQGSPTTACGGQLGQLLAHGVDEPLVGDDQPPLGRHQVAQPIDRLAEHRLLADQASSCLGVSSRLAGQNRVPAPPAMMTAWSMGGKVSGVRCQIRVA